MKALWMYQKSIRTSASSFDSVNWDSSGSPWSSPLRSSLPTVCSRLWSGFSEFAVSPWHFCCTICYWEFELFSFCGVNPSFVLILRWKISDASIFQFLHISNLDIFQNSSRDQFVSKKNLGKIFSDRWGVEVRWFHENSSQDLVNYNGLSVQVTFGFCCDGSKNFLKLFSVSWDVFSMVPNLSLENCVRVQSFLCPLDCLWNLPTAQEDLANDRPNLDCHFFLFSGFRFWCLSRSSFLGQVRHVALRLDLTMTSPAISMLRTNWYQNWMTTLGTTRGTKFSVLHTIFFLCLVNRGFWPLTQSQEYPCSSQCFLYGRTVGESSSICTFTKRSRSWTKPCASSFVCTYSLAATNIVGFLDLRRVSSSSELKSLLHSMSIDLPESTTNSHSSGVFETGAGVALISIGE